MDQDNDYSDLWDTSLRGIDMYGVARAVDCGYFISVPVTPDAIPDAYVTSCHHSMMRAMNRGRDWIGGIYWGRYIYGDIYSVLTPAEIVGVIAAAGAKGYTSYGMNGLDDGGVLNRMDEAFVKSLADANRWFGEVQDQTKCFQCTYRRKAMRRLKKKSYEEIKEERNEKVQGDPNNICASKKIFGKGKVYSIGVQIGAAYTSKNIPHVPYDQRNREMYPFVLSNTALIRDMLYENCRPESPICDKGIEVSIFEKGKIIVNHRSTEYKLSNGKKVNGHSALVDITV